VDNLFPANLIPQTRRTLGKICPLQFSSHKEVLKAQALTIISHSSQKNYLKMRTTQTKGKEGMTSKKTTSSLKSSRDMDNSALHELFVTELKDIYWAEKHLVKNLPKLVKAATSQELKEAIQMHLEETEQQVTRLEQVFESIDEKVSAKKCEAMAGLVEEANDGVLDTDEGTMVRDVAIIASAQKVEHYEIAAYGTLRTLAQVMGHTEAEQLLSETLDEEKSADEKLTEIAEGFVNESASDEEK
jgi:ferritin-like metal-binding protein YciE